MFLELKRGETDRGERSSLMPRYCIAGQSRTVPVGMDARRTGQGQQLLESLHAIKDPRAGCANNRRLMRADHQNVARRFHGRIEGEIVGCERRLRCAGVIAEKRDAIRRLRGSGLGGGLVGGKAQRVSARLQDRARRTHLLRRDPGRRPRFCLAAEWSLQNAPRAARAAAELAFAAIARHPFVLRLSAQRRS